MAHCLNIRVYLSDNSLHRELLIPIRNLKSKSETLDVNADILSYPQSRLVSDAIRRSVNIKHSILSRKKERLALLSEISSFFGSTINPFILITNQSIPSLTNYLSNWTDATIISSKQIKSAENHHDAIFSCILYICMLYSFRMNDINNHLENEITSELTTILTEGFGAIQRDRLKKIFYHLQINDNKCVAALGNLLHDKFNKNNS